jgi:hypothetical protein
VRLSGKFKSIEEWASVSPERERLLIFLVLAAIGALAVVAIGIIALIVSHAAISN